MKRNRMSFSLLMAVVAVIMAIFTWGKVPLWITGLLIGSALINVVTSFVLNKKLQK